MRKPILLAALVIAAMGMTTATATAATEVRDPATGQLCSAVSPAINHQSPPVIYRNTGTPWQGSYPGSYESGGCTIHVSAQEYAMMMSTAGGGSPQECMVSYDLHIGPDGWGYADNFDWASLSPGSLCASWTTQGSRVVMPRDVTPTLGGLSLYTGADEDTDFNVEFWARHVYGGSNNDYHGHLSLDAYVPDPEDPNYTGIPLIIENQRTSPSPFYGGWVGGSWLPETGLTITHD